MPAKRHHPGSDLRLVRDTFERAVGEAELSGDYAIGEAFGVAHTTVWRVRNGVYTPGGRFIAGALRALPDYTFEDLFSIVKYVPRHSRKPDPALQARRAARKLAAPIEQPRELVSA